MAGSGQAYHKKLLAAAVLIVAVVVMVAVIIAVVVVEVAVLIVVVVIMQYDARADLNEIVLEMEVIRGNKWMKQELYPSRMAKNSLFFRFGRIP